METTPLPDKKIIELTRAWLEQAVIGLNLCPFAKAVHAKKQIRFALTPAASPEALCAALFDELRLLESTDPASIDTTLLIHPFVLHDFLDYNDFLEVADAAVDQLGLVGIIQVASFHPHYQFAGSDADDIENHTNRSPFPMLHLLREDSVSRAVEAFPDAEEIPDRNIAALRSLGITGWRRLDAWTTEASRIMSSPVGGESDESVK